MMMANIPNYDITDFTWTINRDAETGWQGSCERSDLGMGPLCGQVWVDACDVGFTVTNPKTGKILLFTLESQRPAKSLDIDYWVFTSQDPKVTIIVYND